jgi:hypothetical protein
MFDVQWQDPNEMTAYKLLEPGEAKFLVNRIFDTSPNGNRMCSSRTGEEMIKVEFEVTDSKSNTGLVNEYIIASQAWKVKQICWAINKPEIYMEGKENGINIQRMVGHSGQCILKTDKPSDPKYDEKTTIAKFIDAVPKESMLKDGKFVATVEIIDDTIPF